MSELRTMKSGSTELRNEKGVKIIAEESAPSRSIPCLLLLLIYFISRFIPGEPEKSSNF